MRSIVIINIAKGFFFKNKVETLAINISLLSQRIWRDILREETTQKTEVEND